MPYFLIPDQISKITNHQKKIIVTGKTINSALHELIDKHPMIERYIFNDSGNIHPFLAIYIEKNNIMSLQGLSTELGQEQTITMLYNISGG